MSAGRLVNIVGGSFDLEGGDISNQISLNCYPVYPRGEEAKEGSYMQGRPGTELALDFRGDADISAPCRGLYQDTTGKIWTAYSDWVIRVNPLSLTFEKIYQIGEGSEDVSFADNGFYLLFCDGAVMYSFDMVSESVTAVSIPFAKPKKVRYFDGRMICVNNDDTVDGSLEVSEQVKNWNRFFYSDTGKDGPITWPALNFETCAQDADRILSFEARQDSLWFFGERSFEVWRPTRIAAKPYQQAGGSGSELGCRAERSTASILDQVFWLGGSKAGSGQVWVSNGYSAKKISNDGIEDEILAMGAEAKNCIGWTWAEGGHIFYVMNFTTAKGIDSVDQVGKTLVYDLTTDKWWHASTRDSVLNLNKRWEAIYAVYSSATDTTYFANLEDAVILKLNPDKYDEWNDIPRICERISPIYWQNLKPMIIDELVLDFEVGVGTLNGQGDDPECMVSMSPEGGRPGSWTSERKTKLGKRGAYQWQPSIRRLGRSRKPAIRIRVSDPVPFKLLGLRLRQRTIGR